MDAQFNNTTVGAGNFLSFCVTGAQELHAFQISIV